jgi:hypothetical protein
MSKYTLLLLTVLLTSCTHNYEKPSEKISDYSNSHNGAGIYFVAFYCQNQRFPKDITELKSMELDRKANMIRKFVAPEPVNWLDFTHMTISYIPGHLNLFSKEIEPGIPIMRSQHEVPRCKEGSFVLESVKTNISVGANN